MGRSITTSTESAFLTVPTSIGFTAGDFVYNQTGGYGRISNTAVSTATFPIGISGCEALYYSTDNQAQMVWADYTGCSEYTNGTAVKLTNGNIVIPYAPNALQGTGTYPYFKVVDSAGAVVVAGTQVDTTNKVNPAATPVIGALALPNGGFVVFYRIEVSGPLYRPAFRVYNASGVAQTAVIIDTTVSLSAAGATGTIELHAAARSDSSFVLVGYDSGSGNSFYRVYNGTTGATVYSGTGGSVGNNFGVMDVVVRSDNSWVMVQLSSSTISWQVRSATNTLSASSSYSTGYTTAGVSAVLMAGDTVRIFGMSTSAIGTALLTGTTMGAETALYSSANYIGLNGNPISAYSFDSGTKFVVTCGASGLNGTYTQAVGMACLVYSSALTRLSPGSSPIPMGMFTPNTTMFSFIEIGTTIRCYKSARPVQTTATTNAMTGAGIVYAAIDKTTYLPVNQQSASYSLGNTSALAVSGYAQSVSTPSRAYFYAASTSGQSAVITQKQVFLAQTVVEAIACDSTQVISLSDGQFAYLYKYRDSPYTIKLALYDKTGTQTNIVTVDSGANTVNGARMVLLSNGKIMVIYVRGSSVLFKVYSSALAVLASGTIGTTSYIAANAGISISPLGVAGRAVIGYRDANSYTRYAVCDDTGTVLTTNTVNTNFVTSVFVCGSRTGNFVISGLETSLYWRASTYYLSGTNTYTNISATAYGSTVNSSPGIHLEPSPDNAMIYAGGQSGAAAFATVDGCSAYLTSSVVTYSFSSTNNYSTIAIGHTANNVCVLFASRYSDTSSNPYYKAFYTNNANYYLNSTADVQLTGLSVAATNGCPSIAPFIGDTCLLSVLNVSEYPTFYAFAPYASTQYDTITGGASVSNPITLSPATRFSLVGVALTTAAAGSTGVIQIRGSAQINTGYQSFSTQSFDFRNPTTLGVSGTVTARTVTLEA
jgi:hypothetical protein